MKHRIVRCDTIRQMITELTGNEMPEIMKIINSHLETCPDCQKWLEIDKKAEEYITNSLDNFMSKTEMSPDLFSRIESSVKTAVDLSFCEKSGVLSESDTADAKQHYDWGGFFTKINLFIPQAVFRLASIIVALLLLCNIVNPMNSIVGNLLGPFHSEEKR